LIISFKIINFKTNKKELINISFQSFEFDITKINSQKPELYVCRPKDKAIIGILTDSIISLKWNPKISQISTLSFDILTQIEIDHQLVTNPNLDLLKLKYLVKFKLMDHEEYFVIITPESSSSGDGGLIKTYECYSLAYILTDEIINYSNEDTDYSKNASEILSIVLQDTLFSIGTVSASLDTIYLSFNFQEITALDCVYELCNSFTALPIFDTINNTVSLSNDLTSIDNIDKIANSTNYGLVFDYSKYIESISHKPNFDNHCTILIPYGNNNLTISSSNVTGSNFISNYGYYLFPFERNPDTKEVLQSSNYFSDELSNCLLDYDDKVNTYEGQFESLTEQKIDLQSTLNTKNQELSNLNIEMLVILDSLDIAQANNQDTDDLLWERDTKQSQIDIKKKEINSLLFNITIDTPCTSSGNILLYLNDITMNIPLVSGDNTTKIALKICDYINNRYYNYDNKFPLNSIFKAIYNGNNIINIIHYTTEIGNALFSYIDDTDSTGVTGTFTDNVNNGLENQIADIDSQMLVISNDLAMENNFTEELLIELKYYMKKKVIRNDNISNPHILLEYAKNQFKKYYSLPIEIQMNIINMFQCLDIGCQLDVNKFKSSEIIRVIYKPLNIDSKCIITEFTYQYSDSNDSTIDVVLSNLTDITSDADKFARLLNNSISTSVELATSKSDWNKINSTNNQVASIIETLQGKYTGELNLASNEYCSLDRRGLTATDPNDPKRILRLTHGILGLSKSGGDTFETCISADGIVAERLTGEMIIGENLTIDASNAEGVQYFTVNQNGFNIFNMILSLLRSDNKSRIIINPSVGFSIQQNKATPPAEDWVDVITIDNNGVINLRELKLNNTEGNTVLNLSGLSNEINFDNFLSKFGTIYADNLNINGMSIKDELGKVWTEINQKGQIINSTNSGLDFIDRDGINAIVIKGEPNKCYGSSFESKDSITNIPSYWSAGQCSTEAVFSGTYSMKLEVNEISQQQQVNNEGFVDSSWFSGQDARISFRQKIGSVRVSVFRMDGIPLNLTDDSQTEIVFNEDGSETINNLRIGTSLDFTYVDEWRNGYRSFKVDLSSYPIGKFYLKFQNIDATNPTYLDQVQIESNYLNKSTIYSDGPRSFSVSELPIDLVSEDFTSDWNSSGVIFNFVKMYTDYPNAQITLSYSNRSEITTQITFSYSPIITNVNGIDYYTGITVYPDGSNLPASITNGKINAIIFSRGMVNQ